jgi:CO dehydrogenase nickel-insertion accessory protein CooC1
MIFHTGAGLSCASYLPNYYIHTWPRMHARSVEVYIAGLLDIELSIEHLSRQTCHAVDTMVQRCLA